MGHSYKNRDICAIYQPHGLDSRLRGNDSNSRFPSMSFLRKQESRKLKSIVTMKYKEDI